MLGWGWGLQMEGPETAFWGGAPPPPRGEEARGRQVDARVGGEMPQESTKPPSRVGFGGPGRVDTGGPRRDRTGMLMAKSGQGSLRRSGAGGSVSSGSVCQRRITGSGAVCARGDASLDRSPHGPS